MQDEPCSFARGRFTISTDRRRLDLAATFDLLRSVSWASDLAEPAQLERAIANSLCFGVYEGQRQVGLARVVTDLITYAYLTDLIIADTHRGRGLGRWLVDCILTHPDLQGLRRITLLTLDAQRLYESAGFVVGAGDSTYMERPRSPRGSQRTDEPQPRR